MIELIRSWLIGVTCAALVVALAESLAPKGTVQKIGRLTGGLVLLIAMLQPLMRLEPQNFAGILTEYRVEASEYSALLETENARLLKGIIEEEAGAYILDKANALGIDCRVAVEAASAGETSAYPVPDTVTITGNLTEEQERTLVRQIEINLAIPRDRQIYEREDVK
ncbi:MAG: stage III sporulation protein AF [Pseudoflavonifractor sp.]